MTNRGDATTVAGGVSATGVGVDDLEDTGPGSDIKSLPNVDPRPGILAVIHTGFLDGYAVP